MNSIRTFLSHSDKDKVIARKFTDELSKYGFDVFVAHDDIGMGAEWENTLKEEIKNRDAKITELESDKRKILRLEDKIENIEELLKIMHKWIRYGRHQ